MNIQSIRLHPFAGVQERTVELNRGLNLILGPNEAGKSTLFKALLHGLFSPAVLTSQQTEKIMGDFFPVNGGDVIRVDIVLEKDTGLELEEKKQVRIKKVWKRGNRKGSAALVLSDGTEITEEREVQSRIEEMLPVSPATMRTVLLSSQSALQATLDRMKQDMEVRQELGTVLRRGVMETGGVSVDRFRTILEKEYENYFKRWNREQQYPENNRGIRNPYKKDYGTLVGAFYTLERARLKYQEAVEFENAYDEVNKKISQLSGRRGEIKKSYDELNPLKKAVQQRRSKESEFKLLENEIETYREVNKLWPVREERLKALEPELETAEAKIESLKQEIERAEKRKAEAALRERCNRLESLKNKLDKAGEEERSTPEVTPQKVSELRALQTGLERVNAQIEAAKLSVSLEGNKSAGILWREAGADTPEEITLQDGESEKRSASGGFILEAGDFTLRVFSGEGDIEELIAEREEKERSFDTALGELKAADLGEAESMAEQRREKTAQRKHAEQRYYEELGDDDLEALQTQLSEAEAEAGEGDARPVSTLYEEKAGAESRKRELLGEKERLTRQIAQWRDKYGSHDEVIDKLGDMQYTKRKLQAELDELPSLPEGYGTADAFIRHVEELDETQADLGEKVSGLHQERARLEGRAPDSSSEELEREIEQAESDFERIKQEAEVLLRVRDESLKLIDSLDGETYSRLEESFVRRLSRMSGQRFRGVLMEQDIPGRFITGEDITGEEPGLPFELLSHGTKGTAALAWRFALCEHFLGDTPGIIVLDDPLVDMDPQRRASAAAAIEDFSENHQILLLTCHPDHAEIMNSGRVHSLPE